MNEEVYWIWLSRVVGPASARGKELLAVYGSPKEVYEARQREDFSPYLTDTQAGRLRQLSLEDCLPAWARGQRAGIRLLPYGGEGYPARLADIPDPPLLLYATGAAGALEGAPAVAIIGSRRPSAYGTQAARTLAAALAKAGAVVVSGLADGLDGEAHRAALEEGGRTVGFLGCAIDQTYPASNRPLRARMEEKGEVFSEYEPGEGGQPSYFLQRNRLIAAACDLICVAEARLKSGTMSTVRHALRYGRPVFAVPGEIFSPQSEGTNTLLSQGHARPVVGPETLLEALGLKTEKARRPKKKKAAPPPQSEEGQILRLLGQGPCTLGQLSEALARPSQELFISLTRLEMEGLVYCTCGMYTLR